MFEDAIASGIELGAAALGAAATVMVVSGGSAMLLLLLARTAADDDENEALLDLAEIACSAVAIGAMGMACASSVLVMVAAWFVTVSALASCVALFLSYHARRFAPVATRLLIFWASAAPASVA